MIALPRLHAVTNDDVLSAPDFLERAHTIVANSDQPVAIHLRAAETSAARLFELGTQLNSLRNCVLMVSDRIDLALALNADGVHLRGTSLSIPQARQLTGELLIGYSAHSRAEALRAEADGANYVFLGSIFETPSHPDRTPIGLGVLRETTAALKIPVIAIGGISDDGRKAACIEDGAYGIAAIRYFWEI